MRRQPRRVGGRRPGVVFGSPHPVAASVFESPDPAALAPFWSGATSWLILGRDGTHVWLRDPTTDGPYLDIRTTDDPKTIKLASTSTSPLTTQMTTTPPRPPHREPRRRPSTSAKPLPPPGTSSKTPQGNELCVLSSPLRPARNRRTGDPLEVRWSIDRRPTQPSQNAPIQPLIHGRNSASSGSDSMRSV